MSFQVTLNEEELGPEIGYNNLVYWAYENMIKAEEVDKTLKALVDMGYFTPIVEVRCPECGAHLGDFKQLIEIPEKIQCDECGHWTVSDHMNSL